MLNYGGVNFVMISLGKEGFDFDFEACVYYELRWRSKFKFGDIFVCSFLCLLIIVVVM